MVASSQLKDGPKAQRPGEHLQAEIKRLGLDQAKLSAALGVSRQSINNIVNGRQPISRAMAKKLAIITGRADDYWLRNTFRPRKKVAVPPPLVTKPARNRKQKRIEEPFRSFVLSLPDAREVDSIYEIIADPKFPTVATWAQFRFYLLRQGLDDEIVIIARVLWKKYVGSLDSFA